MKAIIYAMHKEIAAPFEGGEALENGAGLTLRRVKDDLLVCVCGVGKVNTALAAQYLIDRFAVTEVWNAGVTGCFHDDPAGTLLCAKACVQHDMDTFGDPPGLIPVVELIHLPCAGAEKHCADLTAAGYPCRVGVVASGDWFGRDFDRAARIRDHFSADVCDMEAAAAAQVCLRNGVPFHCLKVVSDHLFHPSQYEEYQANLPAAVQRLNEALAMLMNFDSLDYIYRQLEEKFDLVLTTAFSLDEGFSEDFKVLCGESSAGKFRLYKEDDYATEFVFSAVQEYGKLTFSHKMKFFKRGVHWHPQSVEEAMDDVASFMEGSPKYQLRD